MRRQPLLGSIDSISPRWLISLVPTLVLCIAPMLFTALGPVARSSAQNFHFGEDDFDKTSFSRMTQLEARQKCEEGLQRAIALTESALDLSGKQREKLQTAGRIDIHRFFVRYETAKRGIPFGNLERGKFRQVSADARDSVRDLSREFLTGLHGRESLLEKTLVSMLATEELARVKAAKNAAELQEYAEQIDTAMLVIGRQASLSKADRQAIKEKLLTDTEPPAVFGTSLMPLYFVLANMGKIEEELRGMVTESQWGVMVKLIQAGQRAIR